MLYVQKWPPDDELVGSKQVEENLIGEKSASCWSFSRICLLGNFTFWSF